MKQVLILSVLFLLYYNKKESKIDQSTLASEILETLKKELKESFKGNTISEKNDSIVKLITKKSNDFYLTTVDKKDIDFSNPNDTIFLKNRNGKIITEIPVDVEAYENNGTVLEITNHNLDNVKRIISIHITECICGCSMSNICILETLNNKYIELPIISFSAVESGEPDYYYQFGKQNTIYSVEKTFKYSNDGIKSDNIKKLEKLIWNGSKIVKTQKTTSKSYVVTALNGLIIRDKPSLKSKRIGKLPYMSQTTIQEITKEVLELKDGDNIIKGNWVKIEYNMADDWSVGYVFNGFLQEKTAYIHTNKEILLPSSYTDFYAKKFLDKLSPHWIELYEENDYFYLNAPEYIKERGYSECSGDSLTNIITERKTLLYINDLSLSHGDITSIAPPNKELWPGDEFYFDFNYNEYHIKVSGNYTKEDFNNGYQGEKEYSFSLVSSNHSEIIFTQNEFNDTVPKIIFIGDIDEDGKPDFIIDNPRHYEEERKTLLLSSDAEKGDFIKKRAEFSLDFSC